MISGFVLLSFQYYFQQLFNILFNNVFNIYPYNSRTSVLHLTAKLISRAENGFFVKFVKIGTKILYNPVILCYNVCV